jgi:hypothetical protein
LRNFTARIAFTILALGLADGVVGAWLYRNNPFPASAVVFAIAAAFFAFLWVRLDADQRGYRRSPFLTTSVVGLTVVAIPYYLFRTRGFRKGCVGILAFLGLLIGYGVMGGIGKVIVRVLRT